MESLIYGLECNGRSLTTQQDAEEIRFFVGTQMINGKNSIHCLEVDDENLLSSKIFRHNEEIWKLTSCPHDKLIASVYTSHKRSSELVMQSAILRIPEQIDPTQQEVLEFAGVEILDTEKYGNEIKTTEFHPSANMVCSVVDGKILLFNRAEAKSVVVAEITGKKFGGGKFSGSSQFVSIYENGIRSYDIRDTNTTAWQIDQSAVREIDINPNKAFHVGTASDDGVLRIFDVRNNKEPVFSTGFIHQHWIFSISFNKFHDQLLLSSSSDGKVVLTCASSCSSEAPKAKSSPASEENEMDEFLHDIKRSPLKDGVLEIFTEHEESVYAVEWSSGDPWTFASLSFDGRVIITRIPKKYKYQILL